MLADQRDSDSDTGLSSRERNHALQVRRVRRTDKLALFFTLYFKQIYDSLDKLQGQILSLSEQIAKRSRLKDDQYYCSMDRVLGLRLLVVKLQSREVAEIYRRLEAEVLQILDTLPAFTRDSQIERTSIDREDFLLLSQQSNLEQFNYKFEYYKHLNLQEWIRVTLMLILAHSPNPEVRAMIVMPYKSLLLFLQNNEARAPVLAGLHALVGDIFYFISEYQKPHLAKALLHYEACRRTIEQFVCERQFLILLLKKQLMCRVYDDQSDYNNFQEYVIQASLQHYGAQDHPEMVLLYEEAAKVLLLRKNYSRSCSYYSLISTTISRKQVLSPNEVETLDRCKILIAVILKMVLGQLQLQPQNLQLLNHKTVIKARYMDRTTIQLLLRNYKPSLATFHQLLQERPEQVTEHSRIALSSELFKRLSSQKLQLFRELETQATTARGEKELEELIENSEFYNSLYNEEQERFRELNFRS